VEVLRDDAQHQYEMSVLLYAIAGGTKPEIPAILKSS
jgi:hypothetical protein